MKNEQALPDGEMVPSSLVQVEKGRAWSTLPRGRPMRTYPAAYKDTPTKTIVGEERQETSIQLLHDVPERELISMSALLTTTSLAEHDHHLYALASFLASSASQDAKLARLRILMTLVTPREASWQLQDRVVKATLHFLTKRHFVWLYPEHLARVLLWELRAMCLYEIERRSLIVTGGEAAADCIFSVAHLVEHGLSLSVPLIHFGLDIAGHQVKMLMTPERHSLMNSRDEMVTRIYTDAAKRATDGVRKTVRRTAHGIRDASTESIHKMARKFEQDQLVERLVPDQGHREVLMAAGKVGMASLGAAAIVGEAMFDTTKAVAQKSASVTADVVRYKYGENAGCMVEDASHTTGNILRTAAHVAFFEASVIVKAVAKNTGRVQEQWSSVDQQTIVEPGKGSLDALEASSSKSTSVFESTLTEEDERKKQRTFQSSPHEGTT